MDETSSSFKVMNNKDLLTLIFSYFRDKPSKICVLNKKVKSDLDLEFLTLFKFNCSICYFMGTIKPSILTSPSNPS
jgi:hypothetical protein